MATIFYCNNSELPARLNAVRAGKGFLKEDKYKQIIIDALKFLVVENKIKSFLTDGNFKKTELGIGLYAATWEYQNQVLAIVVHSGNYGSYFDPSTNTDDLRNVSLPLPAGTLGNVQAAFVNRPTGMTIVNGKLEGKINLLDVHAYIIDKTVTGSEGLSTKQEIEIHPNPAKDKITISGNVSIGNSYEITTIEGKSLQTGAVIDHDISIFNLKPGLYLIKIKTEAGETVQRFVKE